LRYAAPFELTLLYCDIRLRCFIAFHYFSVLPRHADLLPLSCIHIRHAEYFIRRALLFSMMIFARLRAAIRHILRLIAAYYASEEPIALFASAAAPDALAGLAAMPANSSATSA